MRGARQPTTRRMSHEMRSTAPGCARRMRAPSVIPAQTQPARQAHPQTMELVALGRRSSARMRGVSLTRTTQDNSTTTPIGTNVEGGTNSEAQIATVSFNITPAKTIYNKWSFKKYRSRAAEGRTLIGKYFSIKGILGLPATRVDPVHDLAGMPASYDNERVGLAYANDITSSLNAISCLYMLSHALDFRRGESTPRFIKTSISLMIALILGAIALMYTGFVPLLVIDLKYLPQPYNILLTLGQLLVYFLYYIVISFVLVIKILRSPNKLREFLQQEGACISLPRRVMEQMLVTIYIRTTLLYLAGDPLLFISLIITQVDQENIMPCQASWLFYIIKTFLVLLSTLVMQWASVPNVIVATNVFTINALDKHLNMKVNKEKANYHEFVRLAQGSKSEAMRIGLKSIDSNLGLQMRTYSRFIRSYEKLISGVPSKVNNSNKWIAVFWAMTLFMGPGQTIKTDEANTPHQLMWAVLVTLSPNFVSALIRVIVYVVSVLYTFSSSSCVRKSKETILLDLRELHDEADLAREEEGLEPDHEHWGAYERLELKVKDVKFQYQENQEYDGALSSVIYGDLITLIISTLTFLSLRVVFRSEHLALISAVANNAPAIAAIVTANLTAICEAASNSSNPLVPGVGFIVENLAGRLSSTLQSLTFGLLTSTEPTPAYPDIE